MSFGCNKYPLHHNSMIYLTLCVALKNRLLWCISCIFLSMKKGRSHGVICHTHDAGGAMSFRLTMQHYFNPLHVYCRLCGVGLSRRTAHRISSLYERLYRLFGFRVSAKTPAD